MIRTLSLTPNIRTFFLNVWIFFKNNKTFFQKERVQTDGRSVSFPR